jgi:hypothetical protein
MNNTELFHCKLAQELGMPLTVVLNLPASEILRWQDYFREHMFSVDRLELQLATIACLIHNTNYKQQLGISDFIPNLKKTPQTPSQVVNKLEVLRGLIGNRR